MKSKFKNAITFLESAEIKNAMDGILSMVYFTMELYEQEALETLAAHDEANKLIFSKPFYALSGLTVAQWIARGGQEKKAREVIKDLIADTVKASQKLQEQKNAMAKAFQR